MRRIFLGVRNASEAPGKRDERRGQAAVGPPFFWKLFVGNTKKGVSAVGQNTDIKLPSLSDTKPIQSPHPPLTNSSTSAPLTTSFAWRIPAN
jgi:hypothetical protein